MGMCSSRILKKQHSTNYSLDNKTCCQKDQIIQIQEDYQSQLFQTQTLGVKSNGVNQDQYQLFLHSQQFQKHSENITNYDIQKKITNKTTDETQISGALEIQFQKSDQAPNFPTNNYTHFLQSQCNFNKKKKKEIETVTIQLNGTIQTQKQLKEESWQVTEKQNQCFHCEKQFQYEIYITPCKHKFHLQCLLNVISDQIDKQQYKIKCQCQERIHINFLRQINFENKLSLITTILNNQVLQMIEENQEKIKDVEQIKILFNQYKSKQDYYYGETNNQSMLFQTNQTPGEN